MTELENKVLDLIKREGPILPIRIAKEFNLETYLASAILSTLFARKKIKMSFRKIGSSPLYYVEGQEKKVQDMLMDTLSPLELKALDRIKELRVALEEELYPQERFLLKELRDFVDQVTVRLEDGRELVCWKLKEVSQEELEEILTKKLKLEKEEIGDREKAQDKEEAEERIEEEKKEETKEERIEEKETKVKETRKKKSTKSRINWNEMLEKIAQYGLHLEKEIEAKTTEFVGIFRSSEPINQKYFVSILNKKNATISDLSRIYVEAISEKFPAIVFVRNLAKKTEDYAKSKFGNLLKIIKI